MLQEIHEQGIKGTIEHHFRDELNFGEATFRGIDIETTVVTLIREGQEDRRYLHSHPVNQFPQAYFKTVSDTVDSFLRWEQAATEYRIFLTDTYSGWTTAQKIEYHYGQILFQDRMQGGIPATLEGISARFNISTCYLSEMIQYDHKTPEWRNYARKLDLLEEAG